MMSGSKAPDSDAYGLFCQIGHILLLHQQLLFILTDSIPHIYSAIHRTPHTESHKLTQYSLEKLESCKTISFSSASSSE